MSVTDIDPPAIEPVDLGYAKEFLRVDSDAEDGLIVDLIKAARIRIENMVRTSLIVRRRRFTSDKVSQSGTFINHSQIRSIDTVRVFNAQGETTVIDNTALRVNLKSNPPSLRITSGRCWADFIAEAAYFEIDFTAGYGVLATDIPMPFRQAILLLLANSFEYRDASLEASPTVPMMVDALLMPYQTVRL